MKDYIYIKRPSRKLEYLTFLVFVGILAQMFAIINLIK